MYLQGRKMWNEELLTQMKESLKRHKQQNNRNWKKEIFKNLIIG